LGFVAAHVAAVAHLPSGPARAKPQTERQYHQTQTQQPLGVVEGEKATAYDPGCPYPKNREDADLCEQRRMAKVAEDAAALADSQWWIGIAQAFLGALAVAAAIYAALEAGRAARAATKSADISERALRGLERPYLFIEEINTEKLNPPPENKPEISYSIRNYGKVSAILRSLSMTLQPIGQNLEEPRLPIGAVKKYYTVVEPGRRLVHRSGKDVAEMDVKGSRPGQSFGGILMAGLVLRGSLHYEDPTGAYHIDEFCLQGNRDGQSWNTVYRRRKTTYPKQEGETDT
jgi:hypothetical protein